MTETELLENTEKLKQQLYLYQERLREKQET